MCVIYSLCVWESCASFAHLNADEQIVNQKKNGVIQYSRLLWDHIRKYTHTHTHSACLSFIDYFGRLCQSRVEFGKKIKFWREFASISCEFLSISFHFGSLPIRCIHTERDECHSMFLFGHLNFRDMLSNRTIYSIFKWKVVLMIIHKILLAVCVIGCTRIDFRHNYEICHQCVTEKKKFSKKREQKWSLRNINNMNTGNSLAEWC